MYIQADAVAPMSLFSCFPPFDDGEMELERCIQAFSNLPKPRRFYSRGFGQEENLVKVDNQV